MMPFATAPAQLNLQAPKKTPLLCKLRTMHFATSNSILHNLSKMLILEVFSSASALLNARVFFLVLVLTLVCSQHLLFSTQSPMLCVAQSPKPGLHTKTNELELYPVVELFNALYIFSLHAALLKCVFTL